MSFDKTLDPRWLRGPSIMRPVCVGLVCITIIVVSVRFLSDHHEGIADTLAMGGLLLGMIATIDLAISVFTIAATKGTKTRTAVWVAASLFVGGPMAFMFWALWLTSEADRYVGELGPQIRDEFGFGHGSPYVHAGDRRREVFTVYPEDGGYLMRVGFRHGDIVLSGSITGFYKLLYLSRNKTVTVTVVDGGDGPPLEDRVARTLEFYIPD